jgi:four helix bundle protein
MEAGMKVRTFQDLRVWQAAYKLSIKVYGSTTSFPKHEQYGLSSQMQRASVSVCSNIAEGFGRRSIKEKDQFYSMANGSLTELENQILIAKGIGYIKSEDFTNLYNHCEEVHKMLVKLQVVNKQKGERS